MAHLLKHQTTSTSASFAAELDAGSVHSAVVSPHGGSVFEMCGVPVTVDAKANEGPKSPARMTEAQVDDVRANPWPFHLEHHGRRSSSSEKTEDLRCETMEANDQPELANPWPYHGPADGGFSATVYPPLQNQAQQQPQPQSQPQSQDEGRKSSTSRVEEAFAAVKIESAAGYDSYSASVQKLSSSTFDIADHRDEHGCAIQETGLSEESDTTSLDVASYPAPLRVSRPNSTIATSPSIKPYCPPPERDDICAGGYKSPVAFTSPPKSPTLGVPHSPSVQYQPYRPPSVPHPSAAPSSQSLQSSSVMGAAPHHFYMPYQQAPHEDQAATTIESPTSTIDEPFPAPVMNGQVSSSGQANLDEGGVSIKPYSPPTEAPVAPPAPPRPPLTGTVLAAGSEKPSSNPPEQAPILISSPRPEVNSYSPTSTHDKPLPPRPSSNSSSHNNPPPAKTTSPTISPTFYHHRPPAHHAKTSPSPNYDSHPSSPPPPPYPYPYGPGISRPESEPLPATQYPSCSHLPPPPPPAPYPAQPTYAKPPDFVQQQPFSSGGRGAPPPLPPRRQVIPCSGFGVGASHPVMYPPPPKTYYNPVPPAPPPFPPRPGSNSMPSSSLFSSSSAKKWLDKTSLALESKLEAVLQGPQGPYRPASGPGPEQWRGAPPPPGWRGP